MEEVDLPGAVEETLAEMDQLQRAAREALEHAFQEVEQLYLEVERHTEHLAAEFELAEPDPTELENMRRERDELNDQLRLLQQRLAEMPQRGGDGPQQDLDAAELHELQTLASPGAAPLRAPFEKLRRALGQE